MEKWFIKNEVENFNKIKKYFEYTNFQKIILANRNITNEYELKTMLNSDINDLRNPLTLKDMRKAVDILFKNIIEDKKIMIVGDYDQDGVSSTVILYKGIKQFYKSIIYSIPDRLEDGYGINTNIVDKAISQDVSLIITCDNGIAAFEAVEYAKNHGLDVIITDHHEVPKKNEEDLLPIADAIVNPHRQDDQSEFKSICGALVAYKFIQAIHCVYGSKLGLNDEIFSELIQFAALGTICDVMPLVNENRIVVMAGLRELNKSKNIGIQALIREINWNREITVYTVGFLIGPIINASGRLFTAKLGVELFLEKDYNTVLEYARELISINETRKKLTIENFEIAINQINDENLSLNDIIVVYNPVIHESICGLVAGRIKEKYHKPSIVLTNSNTEGIIKGSGRSIEKYDMYSNLSKFKHLFVAFGGHKMACGLSLNKDSLKEFNTKLNESSTLTKDDFYRIVEIDYILDFKKISLGLIEQINQLSPYGQAFKKPIFASTNVILNRVDVLGKNKNVLKFYFEQNKIVHNAISFNIEHLLDLLNISIDDIKNLEKNNFDIVYKLEINTYNGNENIQLEIVSMRYNVR